jgi:hypothetical protein
MLILIQVTIARFLYTQTVMIAQNSVRLSCLKDALDRYEGSGRGNLNIAPLSDKFITQSLSSQIFDFF